MNTSSIAYRINAGYVILVGLLLVIGLMAYAGVTRMLDGVQQLNSGIEATRSNIKGAVEQMGAMGESIAVLQKSEAEFSRLTDIQKDLGASQQVTADIGEGLKEVEKHLDEQITLLQDINSSVEVLTQGISQSAPDIRAIILSFQHQYGQAATARASLMEGGLGPWIPFFQVQIYPYPCMIKKRTFPKRYIYKVCRLAEIFVVASGDMV